MDNQIKSFTDKELLAKRKQVLNKYQQLRDNAMIKVWTSKVKESYKTLVVK